MTTTKYRVTIKRRGFGGVPWPLGRLEVGDLALAVKGPVPGWFRALHLQREQIGRIDISVPSTAAMPIVQLLDWNLNEYPFWLALIKERALADDLTNRGYKVQRSFAE